VAEFGGATRWHASTAMTRVSHRLYAVVLAGLMI